MEIQRQSEYYSIDLPETRRVSFTADQIRDMTSGPSIPTGLLNTRTAWREGQEWTYDPAMHVPDSKDEAPDWSDEDYYLDELDQEQDAKKHHIPDELVEDLGEHPHRHHGKALDEPPREKYISDFAFDYPGAKREEYKPWDGDHSDEKKRFAHYRLAEEGAPTVPDLIRTPDSGSGGGSFGSSPMGPEIGGTAMPTMGLAAGALRGGLYDQVANEVGFGSSMTGQENTPSFNPGPKVGYHYASDDEVKSDLTQAVGDEVKTIGEYQGFLDDAEEAGDDQAAAALSESIQDEQDHAKNFGEALAREAYYRYRS